MEKGEKSGKKIKSFIFVISGTVFTVCLGAKPFNGVGSYNGLSSYDGFLL